MFCARTPAKTVGIEQEGEPTMEFTSTRNNALRVSAAQAIVQGLSEEGGLFVPTSFPKLDVSEVLDLDYCALAARVLGGFLTDYDPAFLSAAARQVYGEAFGGKAGQVAPVADGLYALELWHGPTCAFKDYALQLMPRLLVEAKRMLGRTETTRILVATSGDTGKAALEGYKDIPGIEIEVFYPTGGTSEIQRLQMATQQGENVAVYAVRGNFDDAQTGVKKVFGSAAIAAQLAAENVALSSANSINWGRLAPQIVYYYYAYARLVQQGAVRLGDAVDFCVPTGNFGDILAGYYAKQMGLPVGRLLCASNKNNVLTDFLTTGVYDANRAFYKTQSPSMDILVSSNLERLLYHASGCNSAFVADMMASLAAEGRYAVPAGIMEKIRADFAAGWADDGQAAAEIAARWQDDRYLCDTHTAVAFRVARNTPGHAPCVVLSTASPFKFPAAVLAALGQPVPQGDFDAIRALSACTGAAAPAGLAELESRAERFGQVIDPADIPAAALGRL